MSRTNRNLARRRKPDTPDRRPARRLRTMREDDAEDLDADGHGDGLPAPSQDASPAQQGPPSPPRASYDPPSRSGDRCRFLLGPLA